MYYIFHKNNQDVESHKTIFTRAWTLGAWFQAAMRRRPVYFIVGYSAMAFLNEQDLSGFRAITTQSVYISLETSVIFNLFDLRNN